MKDVHLELVVHFKDFQMVRDNAGPYNFEACNKLEVIRSEASRKRDRLVASQTPNVLRCWCGTYV